MKTILTSVLFVICNLQSAIVYSQPPVTQEWVRTYNGPDLLNDEAHAIVVDKWGNCIVTGHSIITGGRWVIATVKYNTQGVQQWVRVFDDITSAVNEPYGIAVDTFGNVIVAGSSGNPIAGIYYGLLIMYNTAGDSLWTRRYGLPGLIYQAYDVITDNAGNIYVTGMAYKDAFTIKYNTNGDSLWVRTHKEPGYLGSRSNSIALDATGNVYIGGFSWKNPGGLWDFDFLVAKYNNSGVLQWSRNYGVLTYNDYVYEIAVDRNSNVYATGYTNSPTTNDDYLTVKYNSVGVQQWVRTFHRGDDMAYSIAIDFSDNVVVTGRVGGSTGYDYGTIKYNANGDSLWVRIYNGFDILSDEAYAVIIDSSNSVYVTGRSERDIYSTLDIVTIKYSGSGAQQWLMRYPGTGAGASTRGLIAIDNVRNIFVSGSNGDYVTIKYSQFVGIEPNSTILPKEFSIWNKPNPFNSQTTISVAIPYNSFVNIKIFDVVGREMQTLANEELKAGEYDLTWDADTYASGVYFYRIEAGTFVDTKKMVLVK